MNAQHKFTSSPSQNLVKPDVMVHACNPSTQKAGLRRSLVPGQPGLHKLTCTQSPGERTILDKICQQHFGNWWTETNRNVFSRVEKIKLWSRGCQETPVRPKDIGNTWYHWRSEYARGLYKALKEQLDSKSLFPIQVATGDVLWKAEPNILWTSTYLAVPRRKYLAEMGGFGKSQHFGQRIRPARDHSHPLWEIGLEKQSLHVSPMGRSGDGSPQHKHHGPAQIFHRETPSIQSFHSAFSGSLLCISRLSRITRLLKGTSSRKDTPSPLGGEVGEGGGEGISGKPEIMKRKKLSKEL